MNRTPSEEAGFTSPDLSRSAIAMNRELTIRRLDYTIEASLLGLLIVLPIAHMTAVRSFFVVSAGLLCLVRMGLSGDWKVRTPLDLPLLFYAGTVFISVFYAINPLAALKEIKGELLQYLVVFYAAAYVFRAENQVRRLAVVLSVWVTLLGIIGIAKFNYEGGSFTDMSVRFTSLARGCTNLSDYIVLTFPIIGWTVFRLKGVNVILGRAALIVALVALAYTHARAGWIAVSLELLLLLYYVLKRRSLAVLVLGALVALAFVLPQDILFHGKKEKLRYDTPEQAFFNGTESVRMYQWTNGVKEMLQHPFKGFGYGRDNYMAGMRAAGPRSLDVNSCNAFLDAWLQLGLQGVIALLLIFITLAVTFRRYALRVVLNDQVRSFFFCGLITVAGYFVANLFEGSYVDEMVMTFWLLMGVYIGYGIRRGKAE